LKTAVIGTGNLLQRAVNLIRNIPNTDCLQYPISFF
jgi:hypothetical protein